MKLIFWCNDGFVRLGFVELMINPIRQKRPFNVYTTPATSYKRRKVVETASCV